VSLFSSFIFFFFSVFFFSFLSFHFILFIKFRRVFSFFSIFGCKVLFFFPTKKKINKATKTQRNQRLISTSKIQEITKEAKDFSTFEIYFLPFNHFLELEKIPKHEDC